MQHELHVGVVHLENSHHMNTEKSVEVIQGILLQGRRLVMTDARESRVHGPCSFRWDHLSL